MDSNGGIRLEKQTEHLPQEYKSSENRIDNLEKRVFKLENQLQELIKKITKS